MKPYLLPVVLVLVFLNWSNSIGQTSPTNPAIDINGYLKLASEAANYREARRLTEDEFIRLSREIGAIVLDARSKERFDELHITGAVNLSFPDITVASLQKLFPDKDVKIFIYCNNNFKNAERPFPTKMPSASLNISTFIALYSYGYKNIYELGPLLDIRSSKLNFEGTLAKSIKRDLSGQPAPVDKFK